MSGVEKLRYELRLGASGFSKRQGVDYTKFFSLMVKHTSIRVLLSIVANKDLELGQLDAKTTFLHGKLEEQIFMNQLEAFEVSRKKDMVGLLKKSFYRLKHPTRYWYKRFYKYAPRIGFQRYSYDHCVYYEDQDSDHAVYLLLYMDDIFIKNNRRHKLKQLKKS